MTAVLRVLLCDDDSQFARNTAEALQRKLKVRYGFSRLSCEIKTESNLSELKRLVQTPELASSWDIVFCDLGWSEQTLEGIQVLHDLQLTHPDCGTVLYTAQDEDDIISQALEWKLGFIDQIIKVDDAAYFDKVLRVIVSCFEQKRLEYFNGEPRESVEMATHELSEALEGGVFDRVRLEELLSQSAGESWQVVDFLPEGQMVLEYGEDLKPQDRARFAQSLETLLSNQQHLSGAEKVKWGNSRLVEESERVSLKNQLAGALDHLSRLYFETLPKRRGEVALQVTVSQNQIQVNLKPDPARLQEQRFQELYDSMTRFPRVSPHEALPLSKARFIRFIKETYGGFPQMAEARGLDLNNIYRVSRRFKNQPFLVFKFETILEILGEKDSQTAETKIRDLLESPQSH